MLRFTLLTIILCSTLSVFGQEQQVLDSQKDFINFLQSSLENDVVNDSTTQLFYRESRNYLWNHITDYNRHPEDYSEALSLYYQNMDKYKRTNEIKIDRFEKQIEDFRQYDRRNMHVNNPVLFVGSSSIVYWETAKSFPGYPVLNRGFGGASLPEIVYYYNDVIKKYDPSTLVVYCDIDIERGKSPETALENFKLLVNRVKKDFPQIPIFILSMKPALVDDFIGKDVRSNKLAANRMLSEYCAGDKLLHFIDVAGVMFNPDGKVKTDIFHADGMHLNHLGYDLWDPLIKDVIRFFAR